MQHVTARVILISFIQYRGAKQSARARNLHSPFRRSTSSLSRSDWVCMHYLYCPTGGGRRWLEKKRKRKMWNFSYKFISFFYLNSLDIDERKLVLMLDRGKKKDLILGVSSKNKLYIWLELLVVFGAGSIPLNRSFSRLAAEQLDRSLCSIGGYIEATASWKYFSILNF